MALRSKSKRTTWPKVVVVEWQMLADGPETLDAFLLVVLHSSLYFVWHLVRIVVSTTETIRRSKEINCPSYDTEKLGSKRE